MCGYIYIKPKPHFLITAFCSAAVLLGGCAGAPPEAEESAAQPVQPPPAESVILDAQLLAQNNRFDEAASKLEGLLEEESTNIQALRLLASVYAAAGLRDQSVSVWERIASINPFDPEAAYEVGMKLARQKKWKDLRTRMITVESGGAADSRHYLLIGEADMELGYRSEAEKYLKKAIDLERGRFLLGKMYYDQGKFAMAEKQFKDVLQSNPRNYAAHLHLGWLNYRNEKYNSALTHYTEAVGINPGDPVARLSLAALYEKLGRPDKATEEYKKALSVTGIPRSEKKKVYNSLSRLLAARGHLSEATTLIEKGLSEFPDSGGLYFQWGEVLLKKGRKKEALEKYKRAARDPLWREIAMKRMHSIM